MTHQCNSDYVSRVFELYSEENLEFFTFDLGTSLLVLRKNLIKLIHKYGDTCKLYTVCGDVYQVQSHYNSLIKTFSHRKDFTKTKENTLVNNNFIKGVFKRNGFNIYLNDGSDFLIDHSDFSNLVNA